MTMKAVSILLLSVLALSLAAAAEDSPAYNLMVSDQATERLEFFTSVQIYAIEPKTDKRLDAKPVFTDTNPANPLKIWLDPGNYEFTITVSFISKEMTYFRFEIVEDKRTLVDLTKVEFPDELQPKDDETR